MERNEKAMATKTQQLENKNRKALKMCTRGETRKFPRTAERYREEEERRRKILENRATPEDGTRESAVRWLLVAATVAYFYATKFAVTVVGVVCVVNT